MPDNFPEKNNEAVAGSFRDPCGFLYRRDGVLLRQINRAGAEDFELLLSSGLYDALCERGALVPHEDAPLSEAFDAAIAHRVIRPKPLRFISMPFEWCFSQLKDAALLTLGIAREAIGRGMSLKDASVYNTQFEGARPVFIDTLSFERYEEGEPWVAYGQFCRHFLAPLALMSLRDERLSRLLAMFVDGIPLDLAAGLMPSGTKFKPGLLMHLHAHARSVLKHGGAGKAAAGGRGGFSKNAFLGVLDSLEGTVRSLSWKPAQSEWGGYYGETSYTEASMEHKKQLVREFTQALKPATVCDLGANTGVFSRIAANCGAAVLSCDIDALCIEKNYLDLKKEGGAAEILPLAVDLANPGPGIGWENTERAPFAERARCDAAFALALEHHLAIGNNLPFGKIASFMSRISDNLVIEFVPKDDVQVQRLLASRKDVFPNYHIDAFEAAFAELFTIERREPLRESGRVLFLMRKK